MSKIKRTVGYLAFVLAMVAIATGAYLILVANPAALRAEEISEYVAPIIATIRSSGATAESETSLTAGPKPTYWVATAILKAVDRGRYDTAQVVVASDPRLAGQSERESHLALRTEIGEGGMSSTFHGVTAPDGTEYYVAVYTSPPSIVGYGWLVGTLPFYGIIAAWLANAAWIALDVRETEKASAVGWMMLALLAGPVALGVRLVSRSGTSRPHASFCPSCGSAVPDDASYCVRCGHPIHARCPKCGRRVDLEWAFCGSCGTSLDEEV